MYKSILTAAVLSALSTAAIGDHKHSSSDTSGTHETHIEAEQEISVGDLVLTGGFSRATLPNAPVAGGFLTIVNTGEGDDRLIAATSPVSARAEIHEMAMENDVMKMRELTEGLPIPAGETVTLKPGGFHLMFMDLKQPLVQGEMTEVTLTFEQAGDVTVPLAIGAPNARAAGQGHMGDTSAHDNHMNVSE